jgi:hypothetical protein
VIHYLKILIISVIIIGAIFPLGAFSSPPETGVLAETTPTVTAQSSGIVVIDNPTPNFTLAVTPSLSLSCDGGAFLSSNFVQDTGLINFNQTANCFVIRNNTLGFQPKLAVTHAANQTMVVVRHNTFTFNRLLSSIPLPEQVPALPALVMLLVTSSTMVTVRLIRSANRLVPLQIAFNFSLSELQVMRC